MGDEPGVKNDTSVDQAEHTHAGTAAPGSTWPKSGTMERFRESEANGVKLTTSTLMRLIL